MTERVEGATFAEQTVQLDGRGFVSCTFDGCRIVYAGGPTELLGCTFSDCVWHLEGEAANTITLLGGLGASDGPTGPRLVTGLFSQLRRMRGEAASTQEQASTPERLGVRTADEVRIGDVTIRTSADVSSTNVSSPDATSADEAREGVSSSTDPTTNRGGRRRMRNGRWIFASGDVAWIVVAAGVALATVVLGRTGG